MRFDEIAAGVSKIRPVEHRLELIPGETHHFDRAPERMKAVIRSWLEQQTGKTR